MITIILACRPRAAPELTRSETSAAERISTVPDAVSGDVLAGGGEVELTGAFRCRSGT
ncbi:hypothetical protein GCM10010361_28550 [Streptomyces olivaceiscleroticus]|uniref:Uncharacterized protein n=1 Tax=Streptomyces olivaceiscleroticus TaxID=68245 RepID=A0ABN0ZYB8_9ACTN